MCMLCQGCVPWTIWSAESNNDTVKILNKKSLASTSSSRRWRRRRYRLHAMWKGAQQRHIIICERIKSSNSLSHPMPLPVTQNHLRAPQNKSVWCETKWKPLSIQHGRQHSRKCEKEKNGTWETMLRMCSVGYRSVRLTRPLFYSHCHSMQHKTNKNHSNEVLDQFEENVEQL